MNTFARTALTIAVAAVTTLSLSACDTAVADSPNTAPTPNTVVAKAPTSGPLDTPSTYIYQFPAPKTNDNAPEVRPPTF